MALAGVFDKKTGLAYVINYMEGTISVIDAKKDELINTLKAGKFLRVISKTDDSIYAADKDNVYSVNKDGLKEVMKLDSNGPIVDIVSYNDKIYLAQLLLNKVIVLRAGTYQKITELNVGSVYYNFQIGPGPEKMALNQKYQKLYVLHPITGSISVIDLKNDSVLETILIPQQFRGLRQMFYNEDGEKLYVAACDTNNVAIIDGKTNKLVGPISPEEKAGLEKKLASSNLIVLIGIGIGIIIIITLFYFLIVRKK
jgi:DNA-binding beta-propeller fold protein YncE